MISNELLFLLLNAIIAFLSDILLNILSTRNIRLLEKYSFMNSLKIRNLILRTSQCFKLRSMLY